MNFASKIKQISEERRSRIVLALDPDPSRHERLLEFSLNTIESTHEDICAIKMNLHLLLPLSIDELKEINALAHEYGLLTIADIKLNDIPNTNMAAIYNLKQEGFDAVILNPFMGYYALKETVEYAREEGMGIITLVFMSHKGAEDTYGLLTNGKRLYDIFLEWSIATNVDGIVVGATVPEIIKHCREMMKERAMIFSPGIITQGGDPREALLHGSNYLIVGRSIINAENANAEARRLKEITW